MYLGDQHAFNCPHHLVYEIEKEMSQGEGYDMVGIRDRWVFEAIRLKKFLVIIAPHGTYNFNPKFIKKKLKTFDQVGYYVDQPMRFYSLRVPSGEKKPIEAYQFA